nr:MAG TPA: hypothetical protein [Caudoviricetes sp.]
MLKIYKSLILGFDEDFQQKNFSESHPPVLVRSTLYPWHPSAEVNVPCIQMVTT